MRTFTNRLRNAAATFALLTGSQLSLATNDSIFERHPSPPPVIDSQPVLELYVSLNPKVTVGHSDDGERFIVPISGGHFRGEAISGKVMPGGADWQTVRNDNIKEIFALYSIQTNDGATIVVDNKGIVSGKSGTRYARTSPKFHAPKGKYEWLNEKLFVGTITSLRNPRAVIIRVYQVD